MDKTELKYLILSVAPYYGEYLDCEYLNDNGEWEEEKIEVNAFFFRMIEGGNVRKIMFPGWGRE